VNTKSRALAEVESDMQKTFTRLRGCLDALEPDSDTWLYVMRLCERLGEEAGRAYHLAKTAEGLERVRRMQPHGLPES
jgi:hypothetical protein